MTPRPRVLATRELPGGSLDELARKVDLAVWPGPGGPSPEALQRALAGCDALLCVLTDRVDEALLTACPTLRVVSSVSVGLDHVDVDAATRRGVPVGHTPGVLAETTADLTFALLLASARRIVEADRDLRRGAWRAEEHWDPSGWLGRDVHGATLGVVGLGAIGRAVAARAAGFGMRVLGWSRSGRGIPGVETVGFEALLEASDFVSVHVALAPETRGLIDAAAIRRMRRGAFLVNTARGGIVDEDALVAALGSGHLGGAALDVFATEPLPQDSPLLDAPNLVLAPHIGSASLATRERMATLAVDNLLAGLAGEAMPACANPNVRDVARS